MPGALSRDEALRALALPPTADRVAVKQAYRQLVREHHPDVGGDPATFHRLQRAYELLRDDTAGPSRPRVSRGRPSRPAGTGADDGGQADLSSVDWDAPCPDGEILLDRDRAALLLTRAHDGAVHPLVATSRSPGSRLNRVAAKLSGDLTSRLRVAPSRDDRDREVVVLEVRGATRSARRALDRVGLGGVWTRTRSSSSTLLRSSLSPNDDRRATAVRAVDRIESLLEGLGWPLPQWTAVTDLSR